MDNNFNIAEKRAMLQKAVEGNIENHLLPDTKLNLLEKGNLDIDITHGQVKKGKMTIEIDHKQDDEDGPDEVKIASKDKKFEKSLDAFDKAVDVNNPKNGDIKRSTNKGKKAMVYMDGKWHHFGDSSMGHNYSEEARKNAKSRHAKNLKGDDSRSKAFRVYWKEYWEEGGKVLKKGKDDPCWDDHKQVGMKEKNGKKVPNCIPDEDIKKSIDVDIEKARPKNPNLVLTHIIDKNGHHRIVWRSPEDIANQGEKKLKQEVKPGDKVTYGDETHTVHKVQKNGYVTLVSPNGTKHDKSLKKIGFHNPKTGEAGSGKFYHDEETTEGSAPRPQVTSAPAAGSSATNPNIDPEKEAGLDYELFGSPEERMQDWVDIIDDFANDTSKNLVIAYGTGGVGKTYNVLQNEKIKRGLETGEYVKVTGGTTPAGFFEMLYENRDKKIILDDFDMVYNDPQMLGLLATISRSNEERILKYPGSSAGSGDIPDKFEFTGKIMSISNIDLESNAEGGGINKHKYEELLTNSNKVNLYMTKKETWDLINEYILHRNGEVNLGLKFRNAYGNEIEATVEDRKELAEYFTKNWKDMRELSGRTLTKANAIQQYYKEKGEDWTKKADQMLLNSTEGNRADVEQRFKDFNDSIDMIARGDLKSAVIADVNSNKIQEILKEKGFKKTAKNDIGFNLQRQMQPDYVPREDEKFATEMYEVVDGANITDKALYETLWKHNGKVIIFDGTADKFLKSDIGQGLLKGALDTSGDGQLTWLSKSNMGKYPVPKKQQGMDDMQYMSQLKEEGFSFETDDNGRIDPKTISHPNDLPDRFEFKGRCIFVTNDTANAPQPIQSRSVLADVQVNTKEFVKMADIIANHREQTGNSFSYVFKEATPDEYRQAVNFLRENEGKIHSRHFSEEGVQTIIGKFRNESGRGRDMEVVNAKLRRQLQKGEIDSDLDTYPSVDIYKAFNNLINK